MTLCCIQPDNFTSIFRSSLFFLYGSTQQLLIFIFHLPLSSLLVCHKECQFSRSFRRRRHFCLIFHELNRASRTVPPFLFIPPLLFQAPTKSVRPDNLIIRRSDHEISLITLFCKLEFTRASVSIF